MFNLIPIDSLDKQRIVIRRSVKEAQLFDQMPSRHGDFWELLLCHGGNIFDRVYMIAVKDGCTMPLDLYRWYPRSLFKTLLLVRVILTHVY